MGCDIHIVLECKHAESDFGWVGLRQLTYVPTTVFTFFGITLQQNSVCWTLKNRDYNFFWAIAGVRSGEGEPGTARGLPEDMSDLSRMILDEDSNLHSHSWLTLRELIPYIIRCKLNEQIPDIVANKLLDGPELNIAHDWLGLYINEPEEHDNYRIVFAFDN